MKPLPLRLFLSVPLALLAGAAVAEEEAQTEQRPYFSALYTYVLENDARDLPGSDTTDAGQGYQLSFGMALHPRLGIELAGFDTRYSSDAGAPEYKEVGGKLDGLFFYSRDPAFSPYFGLGVGGVKTKIKGGGESSSDAFMDVGLGFMRYFSLGPVDIALRGDARYRRIFEDGAVLVQGDPEEAVFKLGLVLPFGGKVRAAQAVAATTSTSEADSDRDGVVDAQDQCPGTQSGTPVNVQGCVADATRNADDPNQKFENVHFTFNSSTLNEYARPLLDNAATVIGKLEKQHPGLKVDVSGHTDAKGTDGYNQALSERRADIVRDYLTKKGVSQARINVQAFGESKPAAGNDTEQGRALNRRVELRTHP
jgi:OOP family OmpA-OmpF porin